MWPALTMICDQPWPRYVTSNDHNTWPALTTMHDQSWLTYVTSVDQDTWPPCAIIRNIHKEKVNSSIAKILPVENLLPQNVGSIINYLQKFTEVAQYGAPSFSQPHQLRTMASEKVDPIDWLPKTQPTLHREVPSELHVLHTAMRAGLQITRLTALSEQRTCDLRNPRPTHCLCGHSGYSVNFR